MIGSTSNINSFQNVFGVQKGLSANPAMSTGAKNPAATADLLTLSPTANMMQQFLSMDIQGEQQQGEVDLTGLAQLKQRADMLSNMLQMKLKNFESNLISSMKSAGLDPSQSMEMKNGNDGLLLMNDMPNKEALQGFLKNNESLQGQFQEVARLADLLGVLKHLGGSLGNGNGASGIAGQYAQQAQPVKSPEKRPDAEFVLRVMQGQASYSYE